MSPQEAHKRMRDKDWNTDEGLLIQNVENILNEQVRLVKNQKMVHPEVITITVNAEQYTVGAISRARDYFRLRGWVAGTRVDGSFYISER